MDPLMDIMSDDDDSFECVVPVTRSTKNSAQSPILISSDEESYNNSTIIEDTVNNEPDSSLPAVQAPKKTDHRDKVVKDLFPTNNNMERPSKSSPEMISHKRMIGGVQVDFPVPPYGAQIALMSKVIEGLKNKQNCLLESPTGTGKTLALLCGALAWQKQEKDRIGRLQATQHMDSHPELHEVPGALDTIASPQSTCLSSPDKIFSRTAHGDKSIYDDPRNAAGDTSTLGFKKQDPSTSYGTPEKGLVSIHKKRRFGDSEDSSKTSTPNLANTPEKTDNDDQIPTTPQNVRCLKALVDNLQLQTSMIVNCSLPTIYYGARTHKQIQQVVKEFGRTLYCRDTMMTILSSRDHSCIREFDRSIYKSRNDMCKECVTKAKVPKLIQGKVQTSNCEFYDNRKRVTHSTLPGSFDLEDLVSVGRNLKACPYYAARHMAQKSQIIFCPYNYLIDPAIRANLQINLSNEIVILDEAHNIEDICRESASFVIQRQQVIESLAEIEKLVGYQFANSGMIPQMQILLQALKNWNDWFSNQKPLVDNQPVNNNVAEFTWREVNHFASTLDNHNIGLKQYPEFLSSAEEFCRRLRDDPSTLYGVSQATGTLLESISTVMRYMFREECKRMDDFKPALMRSVATRRKSGALWRTSQFNSDIEEETLSLRIMCMNPGVVFASLSATRAILLSSGTLTPLHSLSSELEADFPLKVSPKHVIPLDRVWVGSLSVCPAGRPLQVSAASSSQCGVQDAVGAAVRAVCDVTPHGVLVFLTSYSLMDKLIQRWRETNLWNELNKLKHVFVESRNVKDHDEIMEEYYLRAESGKGALLLAVYRGKAAEGMDFRDRQARAVVAVGIPYPNTYDMMVKEKKNYNDRHQDRGLLASSEWLRVQAYRALNQAVGRCVRHRADWGAVLLIDKRFAQHYYSEHLAEWIKKKLGSNHHSFESMSRGPNSLHSFMDNMTKREEEEDL